MTTDRFTALIPFHLNGTLDPEEGRRVEDHLAECPACRALLEEARLARRLGGAPGETWDDHVQAQHLERFSLEPADLPPELADWIRTHVAGCEACREAVEVVRRTASPDELLRSPASNDRGAGEPRTERARPRSGPPEGRGWLARTLLHPVPAAVYLLLLLLLVPLSLQRPVQPVEPHAAGPTAAPLVVDLPVLRSPLRGGEGAIVDVVPNARSAVPIAIELPLRLAQAPVALRLSIRDAGGAPEYHLDVPAARVERAFAEAGLLVILLPSDTLGPGLHGVELRPLDADTGAALFSGKFRVPPRR